jgi:LysM repeat protein
MPLVFAAAFGKHGPMANTRWIIPGFILATTAFAQPVASQIDIANLREDVRGLSQRVAELTLRVEQLEAQNAALKEKAVSSADGRVTQEQLNQAIAELNRVVLTAVAAAKEDTLRQMAAEMGKLPHNPSARPVGPSSFSNNFPKDGENYTVQRGDTVASIAKKTGAKVQDIINANQLADPAHIRIGQALFIPGGK